MKNKPSCRQDLVYVALSDIHGQGLFARQLIKKNTLLGYLTGQPTDSDGMYVLWINGTDGFEVSCDLKYINHSDTPNACYYDDQSVMTLRDIQPDEEITHNYEGIVD